MESVTRPRATGTVRGSEVRSTLVRLIASLLAGLWLVAAGAVQASVWGGHNGVVRLSFTRGDSLAPVARVAPGPAGISLDLYAVLDGVDMVFWEGKQVRAIGGFELQLVVEGGPVAIALQPLQNERGDTLKVFNVASGKDQYWVGLYPELALQKGRATIAHWRVHVLGDVRPVVFRLDPTGLFSCATLSGCKSSGTPVIWAGSAAAHMANLLFGAGYTPAYLNVEGEPNLTPVRGTTTWRETGLFTEK